MVPGPPPAGPIAAHYSGPSERRSNRSRSPRGRRDRRREAPVTPQALEADMGKADFNCFVLDCLLRLSSDDFADVWVGLPRELRAVAWRPPPGIIVDIDSLKGPERMQMCAKLNTLRRERCVKLASPKQQAHFEDENWTITPMSRLVCSRFGSASASFPWLPPTSPSGRLRSSTCPSARKSRSPTAMCPVTWISALGPRTLLLLPLRCLPPRPSMIARTERRPPRKALRL